MFCWSWMNQWAAWYFHFVLHYSLFSPPFLFIYYYYAPFHAALCFSPFSRRHYYYIMMIFHYLIIYRRRFSPSRRLRMFSSRRYFRATMPCARFDHAPAHVDWRFHAPLRRDSRWFDERRHHAALFTPLLFCWLPLPGEVREGGRERRLSQMRQEILRLRYIIDIYEILNEIDIDR